MDLLQPVQGEGRAGTVAQPPFPLRAVATLDLYRGIEREAAAALPAGLVERSGSVKVAGTHEPAQPAGMPAHPQHALASELFRGHGGLLSFELTQ